MLLRFVFVSLLAGILSACTTAPPSPDSLTPSWLRFDGVYRTLNVVTKKGTAYTYLRFYPDGTVRSATLIGSPQAYWATTLRNYKYQSLGSYQVGDNQLSFTLKSDFATVEYQGSVHGETDLRLLSHSLTTGFRAQRDYQFFRIDESQLPEQLRLKTLHPQQDGSIKLKDVPLQSE